MVKETVEARIVEFFVYEGHRIDAVLTVFEDAPGHLVEVARFPGVSAMNILVLSRGAPKVGHSALFGSYDSCNRAAVITVLYA